MSPSSVLRRWDLPNKSCTLRLLKITAMQTLELLLGAANIDTAELHPNRMKFRGVLVRLDEPSTKAPNGAEGHRILVPSGVANERLKTLIGMGLNYAEKLDGHAQRRKVGVIENAYIDGQDLWIEGTVWKHDFPEALTDLKQRNLGMSMEIGQVEVEDADASIWRLNDFYFLGATILKRDAAAYYKTQAIAAQLEKRRQDSMPETAKAPVKKPDYSAVVQAAALAAATAVGDQFKVVLGEHTKILASIAERMETMDTRMLGMEASISASGTGDDEGDDENIEATGTEAPEQVPGTIVTKKVAAEKEDEDEDDEEDEEEIDSAGDQEACGVPGDISDDHGNKGKKTVSSSMTTINSAAMTALRKQVKQLTVNQAQLAAENKQLKKQLNATSKQVQAAAEETTRRSVVHPEVTGLLAKAGVNTRTLAATGEKMSVEEVDAVISSSIPGLGVTERMALKNKFLEMGLMENGQVNRGIGLERR